MFKNISNFSSFFIISPFEKDTDLCLNTFGYTIKRLCVKFGSNWTGSSEFVLERTFFFLKIVNIFLQLHCIPGHGKERDPSFDFDLIFFTQECFV